MRDFVRQVALYVWRFILRHSWVLGALGIILAAAGGVATNVTAAAVFKPACGEGQFCAKGLYEFLSHTYEGWMISAGSILSVLGLLASYQDKAEIERLERDVADAKKSSETLAALNQSIENKLVASSVDVFKIFSILLMKFSEDMGLGVNARISLYRVANDKFFIVGSYSSNASFNRVRRNYYERGYGIIEDAWTRGWHELEIRSPYGANNTARRKYAEEQNAKCNMPAGITNALNMKSRSYKALALKGAELADPIAIVCLESTERNGLIGIDRGALETRFNQLSVLITALEHHVATLDNAISEGL